jgi:hypothetical protein
MFDMALEEQGTSEFDGLGQYLGRRYVEKSALEQYFYENPGSTVFQACPNGEGINPLIVVGKDRVYFGGGVVRETRNGVKYFYNQPRFFRKFIEVTVPDNVEDANMLVKKYYGNMGFWRRLSKALSRKTESSGVQPFYDDTVAKLLELCGPTSEEYCLMRRE